MTDFARLSAPFAPDRVSWRVGPTNGDKTKGMALAYIDARDVMQRLDEVCTPAGWQCDYPHAGAKTVCRIAVKIGDEWVWKADGAGDSDMEAEKGALSDAFKRAAVRWGIGRYLYDTDSPWVAIEKRGNTYVIPDSEKARLVRALAGAAPVTAAAAPSSPPAPAKLKPSDPSMKLFAKLTLDINGLQTMKALDDWRKNPVAVADFHDLPPALRIDLGKAIEKKRDDLSAPSGPNQ